MDVMEIGNRLELFVDGAMAERVGGRASLRLHPPTPRDAALVCDRPWEGNVCGYTTVFRDEDRCRMYFHGWAVDLESEKSRGESVCSPHPPLIETVESADGIHWKRPELGAFDFGGSTANNIVWMGQGEDSKGTHGFAPFKDPNPACAPEARYKAVGGNETWPSDGLFAMQSPDGYRWSLVSETPIITDGAFDSQNLVFWDGVRGEYRAYLRDFRDGCRGIKTASSPDFLHWTAPVWLEYPGAPNEQLYTNQIQPYYRAPHLFLGFPTRYVERPWSPAIEALPQLAHRRLRAGVNERFGAAVTDGLFMASRDGQRFLRWDEAFLRPGLRTEGSWTYGDMYQACGMVETASALPGAPPELSVYASENYWRGATIFRRYTLRIDGFVSAHAPLGGGEVVTPPLRFSAEHRRARILPGCQSPLSLHLNVSTSAGGSARVELRTPDDRPFPGFSYADCHEIIGDTLDYPVRWQSAPDLGPLAGHPVRLAISLYDADVYSFRFGV